MDFLHRVNRIVEVFEGVVRLEHADLAIGKRPAIAEIGGDPFTVEVDRPKTESCRQILDAPVGSSETANRGLGCSGRADRSVENRVLDASVSPPLKRRNHRQNLRPLTDHHIADDTVAAGQWTSSQRCPTFVKQATPTTMPLSSSPASCEDVPFHFRTQYTATAGVPFIFRSASSFSAVLESVLPSVLTACQRPRRQPTFS